MTRFDNSSGHVSLVAGVGGWEEIRNFFNTLHRVRESIRAEFACSGGRGDDKRCGVTARGTLMLLGLCVFNFSPRLFRGSTGGWKRNTRARTYARTLSSRLAKGRLFITETPRKEPVRPLCPLRVRRIAFCNNYYQRSPLPLATTVAYRLRDIYNTSGEGIQGSDVAKGEGVQALLRNWPYK